MRIAVVNAMAPFVWGGAEEMASHLIANLCRLGHQAELYRIPFQWEPYSQLPIEIARMKALRFDDADRVISMKFPVYLMDAEHHSTWLIHQYRQAYDLRHSPYCNIPETSHGAEVRALVVASDTAALASRDRLFTISDEVSKRLYDHNGIKAPPLRAPINDPELFVGGAYENYILAPGRINASKRQSLLVEAFKHLGRNARLVIAGPPETERDAAELRRLVEDNDLADQVKLDLRFLPRQELAAYVNNCRAVAYLPYREDSYGYVTMEAFEAGKPVITVDDAGELLDIVADERTGRVVAPSPPRLAEAMSYYLEREDRARDHGEAGRRRWHSTGINWPDNISRLLGS